MDRRIQLNELLHEFVDNVYYRQPPPNVAMRYPCIIYDKLPDYEERADNGIYISEKQYTLTLIERNPVSEVAELIRSSFMKCAITQYYIVDGLYHTKLDLYF